MELNPAASPSGSKRSAAIDQIDVARHAMNVASAMDNETMNTKEGATEFRRTTNSRTSADGLRHETCATRGRTENRDIHKRRELAAAEPARRLHARQTRLHGSGPGRTTRSDSGPHGFKTPNMATREWAYQPSDAASWAGHKTASDAELRRLIAGGSLGPETMVGARARVCMGQSSALRALQCCSLVAVRFGALAW